MIVIKTNLRKIPEKCNKCRYSYISNNFNRERFCAISFYKGMNRHCYQKFNKEKKNNWEYVRPEWCPLREMEKWEGDKL